MLQGNDTMQPQCPHCRQDFVQRARRRGLVDYLLSFAYLYPFRCQLCGHRFLTLQWGIRYHRIAQDSGDHRLVGTPVRANPSCSLR